MGLDSSFFEKVYQTPENFPKHNLCAGMFSRNNNSFWGKAYSEFIHDISGNSLFVKEGDSVYIKTIADSLEKVEITNEMLEKYRITKEEISDLKSLFRFAADNNLVYVGWW